MPSAFLKSYSQSEGYFASLISERALGLERVVGYPSLLISIVMAEQRGDCDLTSSRFRVAVGRCYLVLKCHCVTEKKRTQSGFDNQYALKGQGHEQIVGHHAKYTKNVSNHQDNHQLVTVCSKLPKLKCKVKLNPQYNSISSHNRPFASTLSL